MIAAICPLRISRCSSEHAAWTACQVKQGDAETGEVIVEGIGHRLECPEGIRLSWKLLKSSDHGEEL